MSKAVKKTNRKVQAEVLEADIVSSSPTPSYLPKPISSKTITLLLIAAVVALLTYKLGPKVFPAIVGNRPLTRFELWSRLEKSYGTQVLDDMVNEKILDEAIEKSNIKVDQSKVDEQIKSLEAQFESTGGLDEALSQRGLSRDELIKQIKTQLAVEELLKDKINPSDEDVKKQFESGATTLYKDKKFDEVKGSITEELRQAKLRDEFLTWFAEIKKDIKVKTFGL